MYIAITLVIMLFLIIIVNYLTEDMAIRLASIKYNEEYKDLKKSYKLRKKENSKWRKILKNKLGR